MENNSSNQPIPGPAPEPIQSTPAQPLPPQQPVQPAPNQIFSQPANAPQYNNPQPQSTSSVSIKSIILAVVGVIGAISFFLPWLKVSSSIVQATVYGTDMHDLNIGGLKILGYAIPILFVALVVFALINIMKKLNPTNKICLSAIGGLAALFSVVMVIVLLDRVQGYGSIAIGLYLSIIAGAAATALPWIPIKGQ